MRPGGMAGPGGPESGGALACLEASSALHLALLPIDAVAWNRIPAAPEPLLLEGNSGFHTLDLGEDGHPMNAEPL